MVKFNLQIIKVLTNCRQINIAVMRPIDQLIGILESMNDNFDIDIFNSFVMKYSIEETCAMLIQIIS